MTEPGKAKATQRWVRDYVFDILHELEIEYIFGVPGTNEIPIIDGTDMAGSNVEYIECLHENITMGAAMGYAQTSGKPGVVLAHVTPGIGHLIGNLFNAWRSRMPVVILCAQQHNQLVTQEPLLASNMVQLADQYTKWSHEARSWERDAAGAPAGVQGGDGAARRAGVHLLPLGIHHAPRSARRTGSKASPASLPGLLQTRRRLSRLPRPSKRPRIRSSLPATESARPGRGLSSGNWPSCSARPSTSKSSAARRIFPTAITTGKVSSRETRVKYRSASRNTMSYSFAGSDCKRSWRCSTTPRVH